MKNFIFNNKKGVTVLEGLIALSLLAIVATGTFAVLLSTSRKTSEPDMREEMVLAIERAHEQLQAYILGNAMITSQDASGSFIVPQAFINGLCGAADFGFVPDTNPLGNGTHNIKCMLPLVCDRGNVSNDCNDSTGTKSCFVYRVNDSSAGNWSGPLPKEARLKTNYTDNWNTQGIYQKSSPYYPASGKTITFEIRCNGYTLTK